MKKLSLSILFVLVIFHANATVDTLQTYSKAMNKTIKEVVVLPTNYEKMKEFPVLYLLHGYSGNYADWAKKNKHLQEYADLYQLIIVCPDGGFDSWYFDSKLTPEYQYETYVASELIADVDAHYKTIKSAKGRAITGLSMGGHGALYLAFRHQDVFGAAGSMSGGVDIRPFSQNWGIKTRLGDYANHPENWEQNTVINMLHLLTGKSLPLIIDCGSADFFYEVNVKLHEELLYRNIPHEFISRPGKHDWEYWNNALKYQLLFFKTFFDQ